MFNKLAALCAVLALGGVACSKKAATGDTSPEPITVALEVEVVDNSFRPDALAAEVGDTVTWTWVNTAAAHSVLSSPNGTIASGDPTAEPGTEFSFTFEADGTYDYACEVHGSAMSGVITVGSGRHIGTRGG